MANLGQLACVPSQDLAHLHALDGVGMLGGSAGAVSVVGVVELLVAPGRTFKDLSQV